MKAQKIADIIVNAGAIFLGFVFLVPNVGWGTALGLFFFGLWLKK